MRGRPTVAIAGNGLWLLGGTAAADEIVDAVRSAGTVRYSGTFTELTAGTPDTEPAPGRVLTVEYAGGRAGSSAEFSAGDQRAQVVSIDGRTYTTGNDAYAAATGLADLARGWVCSIGTTGARDEWAPLLDPAELVASLLGTGESIAVETPADADTVVEVIIGSAEAPVGIMTVAREGAPLPVAFTAGDTSGDGSFSFSAGANRSRSAHRPTRSSPAATDGHRPATWGRAAIAAAAVRRRAAGRTSRVRAGCAR